MTSQPGATHRPDLKSWVASAHAPGTEFPIQNLPFGVYAPRGGGRGRVGIAIGDRILDVSAALELGLFDGAREAAEACRGETLNALMALGPGAWSALRRGASDLLRAGSETGTRAEKLQLRLLVPQDETEPRLPAAICPAGRLPES